MSEFVYLFRATEAEQREAMGTPERAQQSMQVMRGKAALVTDGPYVEAKDMVLGFSIIEARDLAQAVELASRCPMVTGGATVEIRPVAQSVFSNDTRE